MKWFIFIFDIFITNSSSSGFMDITKNITIHCDNRRLVRKLKNVSTPWWSLLRKSFPLLPSGFEPVTFDATVALVTVNCRLISPPPPPSPPPPHPLPPPHPNCRPFEALMKTSICKTYFHQHCCYFFFSGYKPSGI